MTKEQLAIVLETVNRIRTAWGWRKLAQLPKAVPNSPCACVLGRSWKCHVRTNSQHSIAYFTFNTSTQAQTALDILGGDAELAMDLVTLPYEHPLVEWMLRFDRGQVPELIALDEDSYPLRADDGIQEDDPRLPDLILA